MTLLEKIETAEARYLHLVEEFFTARWGATRLWSHDLSHHRRVWNYAKELLEAEQESDELFIEMLLIACYMHDIGMSVDAGEKHGLHSRRLCEEFLNENEMDLTDFTDMLQAIENHDDKDYRESHKSGKVLEFLSAADDMDAFGHIGIYRYLEIYLERGIDTPLIPSMILKNAEARFLNLKKSFGSHPAIVEKQRERYNALKDFLSALEKDLKTRNN